MTASSPDRRGIALVSALLILMVALALAAAGSVFVVDETRLAENAGLEARAQSLAESAAVSALVGWTGARRLNDRLYLLEGAGEAGAGSSRWAGGLARVGLLVTLAPPAGWPAALASRGEVTVSDGARVEGTGAVPAAWSRCGGTETPGAGVLSGADSVPLGDVDFDRLAAQAGVRLSGGTLSPGPVTAGATCDTAVDSNWGVPDGNGPCGSYLPVVHIAGDAELAGGRGAGLVLVDGNLTVDDGFVFGGVLIVRGALVVSGSGTAATQLYGTVVTLSHGMVTGATVLTYSNCLSKMALSLVGVPETIYSRPWIRLF